MSTEPPGEHPSAYIVEDRDNLEEMKRLEIQDEMLTAGMGGVLSELADPTILQSILDVGCGTGGWLMETARTYPTIKRLVGADISGKMLNYARAEVEAQQLDKRVRFKTMDALRVLEFPDHSFDLVNQRFGVSWLRTWEWRKLLTEYIRVTRPGGIIRITEYNYPESNSPAMAKLWEINLRAHYHSGRFFGARSDGITSELARLLTRHAIENVQTRVHTLVYRTGTFEHHSFYEDMARGHRIALPFFQKWTRVPNNYAEIYQQALKEMRAPDFVATWKLLTAWGTTPIDGGRMLMRGLM
jgi:ubiquinone/menaquinone biosynthesis C-methylase UbiE